MKASARWGWTVALIAATGAALVLAFVLSFSSQGSGFYERQFVWLFWLNVSVALLLEHLGRVEQARAVEAAVAADLAERGDASRSTTAVGDAIAARLA